MALTVSTSLLKVISLGVAANEGTTDKTATKTRNAFFIDSPHSRTGLPGFTGCIDSTCRVPRSSTEKNRVPVLPGEEGDAVATYCDTWPSTSLAVALRV